MITHKFNHLEISGIIFDLDGVITNTASIHEMAWKKSFDRYLKIFSKKKFSTDDYLNHIDGKPRLKGINDYLIYRNIPITQPLIDIINLEKNKLFLNLIKKTKIEIYPDAINLLKDIKKYKIKVAVASSSKNCRLILKKIKISDMFDFIIDGVDLENKKIRGKPDPDIFLHAIEKLNLNKKRTLIFEDSSSGVISAVKSKTKFVIGVARNSNEIELKTSGANIIVNTINQIRIS